MSTFEFPLLCTLLLLSPLYSNAAAPLVSKANNKSNALVNKACSGGTDKPACINYLKSNPKLMAAAATSKPLEFALAILQSAVDQAKNTHAYLSKPKGKLSPQAIQAYNDCKTNWDYVASGLERSLKIIKEEKGYATDTTDYDLKMNLNSGRDCATLLLEAKIQDPVVAKGLENAELAVGAADTILEGVKPPKKLD
ncbi:uncharacterized protein LOC132048676 [Lycium ferocissimum]|uniref:uncharacterized protein LOC132048676 n=1 Tax=Lycium ferocissimum TaxID=112874 RepID=UPI0028165D41|nr:uncharacterized protein LOC132048676 [Lycium ferocissimum]